MLGASCGQVPHGEQGDGAAAALEAHGCAGQQQLAEEAAASPPLTQEQQPGKTEGQIQANSCNSQTAHKMCLT